MGGRPARAPTAIAVALSLSLGLVLTACSDDDKTPGPDESESSSSSGSASPTEALDIPDGVDLTPGGSRLDVDETATVAYEVRQGTTGVLDITVTRLEKTTFPASFVGWDLDEQTKSTKPYFVRVTILNRGETELGGRPIPLYIVDGTNTLIEPTSFSSKFEPCSPGAFPKRFPPGKSVDACLVFLAPNKGDLTAVSFRPTQQDDPITWTGELKKPKKKKKKKDEPTPEESASAPTESPTG